MDWAFSYGDSSITEETLNNGSSGSCRLCGLLSSMHCKRCGDYYCSEKCQNIDWPNHRYICFPMPPLVRIRNPVHEDEVYPVKPPGTTENSLKELQGVFEIIMTKLQRIENKLYDASTNIMNGNKTPSSETCDVENNNYPVAPQRILNGSVDLGAVQTNSPTDLGNVSVVLESRQIMGSRASLNTSQSEIGDSFTDHVFLCTFRSTNRCAIRSKNPTTEAAYRALIEKIDLYGRTAPQMTDLPKAGSYAITMKSNKNYTRVKIAKVYSESKIRVVFCDYGNTVCRSLTDLRMISDEIANLPEYVSTVQLRGVQMTRYTDKIIEFLKTFERKEYKAKYIKENANTHVELYDIENNALLNEIVLKFCTENEDSSKTVHHLPSPSTNSANDKPLTLTNSFNDKPLTLTNSVNDKPTPQQRQESNTESGDENTLKPVLEPPFQTHIFPAEMCNAKVIIVDTELIEFGYMACIKEADMKHLSKIQNVLNSMEFEDKPYEPKLNEYCVAKYENDWYRALVVTILDGGTKFEVSYIDFLNEATLTSDSIRPYPKDLTMDCYTTLCKIDGLPKKLNSKQREFLKTEIKVNDSTLIDRVIQIIEKKIALIECNDIITLMHDQNLF